MTTIYGGRDVEDKFKRFLDNRDNALIAILTLMWRRQSNALTNAEIIQALQTGQLHASTYDRWLKDFDRFASDPLHDVSIAMRALSRLSRNRLNLSSTSLPP